MHKCNHLKFGRDGLGMPLVRCDAAPAECPRKTHKPPEYPITQSCWKVV